MSTVQVNPPPALLAERRRLGLDVFDEMWEGEVHMVPAPGSGHQHIGTQLVAALVPVAQAVGLQILYETGLYDPAIAGHASFRVPDLSIFRPELCSDRGIEGSAALVVEIRSPGDESFEKLPYYERLGVGEVVIIDADSRQVRHWRNGDGGLVESTPGSGGRMRFDCLPIALSYEDDVLVVEQIDDNRRASTRVRMDVHPTDTETKANDL